MAEGVNVAPLLWALQEHPDLRNRNPARTENPDSPHFGLSDIWCRFAAPNVDGSQAHESVWYPEADVLPVKDLALALMSMVQGEQLGGVLITKIPAGAMCRPHKDPGWHARFYDKFAVQVQAAPGQEFHFEDQSLVTKPGDLFWFDNSHTHWVTNDSAVDRITLICCIRLDPRRRK